MKRPFGAAYLTLSARGSRSSRRTPRRAALPPESNAGATPARQGNAARDSDGTLCGPPESAKRPLVVIGLGIDPANAARIRQWVNDWNLPVAVTPKVKGIVDETAANFVGVVGGMAADGLMCDALAAADLLIGFGLDPVEIDKTAGTPSCRFTGSSKRRTSAASCRRERRSSTTRSSSTRCWRHAAASTWAAPFGEFQQKRRAMLTDRSGAPGVDVAGRYRPGARRGAAAGDDRHDRCRLAQVSVRPVLAEPRAGDVLDVERVVGDGVRA